MAVDIDKARRLSLLLQAVGTNMKHFDGVFARWGIDIADNRVVESGITPEEAVEELAELLEQDAPEPIVTLIDDDLKRPPDGLVVLVTGSGNRLLMKAWERRIGGFVVEINSDEFVNFYSRQEADGPYRLFFRSGGVIRPIQWRRVTPVAGGVLAVIDGTVEHT